MLAHVEIIWPDGSMTRGGCYREVEDNIRMTQPRSFTSRRDFRKDLAARARAWSGQKVPTGGTSREFIQLLAETGLFMIVCDVPDDVK